MAGANLSPSRDDASFLRLDQSGLVRRPDARPQRRAFLGMGFSSLHELAGEYTRRLQTMIWDTPEEERHECISKVSIGHDRDQLNWFKKMKQR
ncbi:hypothetical protein BHE74_00012729 [Ensete ventricosum]|nr:hypothetical protein BHE74_00012729 [Ensete ventricosum]